MGFNKPFLPLTRKRKHNLRLIIDTIFYLNRTGGQRRNLKVKGSIFPDWRIVYYYFRTWTKLGILENISYELVKLERKNQGKDADPSANVIDNQYIKIAPFIPDDKGIDGNKKINAGSPMRQKKAHYYRHIRAYYWHCSDCCKFT